MSVSTQSWVRNNMKVVAATSIECFSSLASTATGLAAEGVYQSRSTCTLQLSFNYFTRYTIPISYRV